MFLRYSLLVCSILATSAALSAPQPPPQAYPPRRIILEPEAWGWVKEAWNGDNAPYRSARSAIDRAAASPTRLADLLSRYKAEAHKAPSNPLAVYRWGYAAYKATAKQDYITAHKTLDGVQQAFQEAPSPHTYDYTRLHFLVGEFYMPHQRAVPAAQRLLSVEKNDYEVAYRLASIYLNVYNPPRIQEALSIIDNLKQHFPSRSSVYTLAGFVYVAKWHYSHGPADAQAVVENYKKFLEVAPPKDDFRKRAQQIIDEYQKKI